MHFILLQSWRFGLSPSEGGEVQATSTRRSLCFSFHRIENPASRNLLTGSVRKSQSAGFNRKSGLCDEAGPVS